MNSRSSLEEEPRARKIGEHVWFIHAGYPIAIRCRIQDVDRYDGDAYEDYDLDEPVGHDVHDDGSSLFASKEEAAEFLIELQESFVLDGHEVDTDFTLGKYREARNNFIAGTQVRAGVDPHKEGIYTATWPDKPRDAWITLNDAYALREARREEFEELYG